MISLDQIKRYGQVAGVVVVSFLVMIGVSRISN